VPRENPDQYLSEMSGCISASRQYLDYPFDTFKKMIEGFGRIFPDNQEFDNLVDTLASISGQRYSELSAGETFFRRGVQKLLANSYKNSIIYFGKSVTKFAKEESQDIMYLALMGLSQAYSSLGLIWASNNCLVSALLISFKEWHEKGLITEKIYDCARQLTLNELLLGRVPSFLSWHELFYVTYKQLNLIHDDEKSLRIDCLIDGLFSVRILNTNNEENRFFSFLPDILARQNLWLSQNSCLYKLGHIDSILDDFKKLMLNDEPDIDKCFKMMADQPFKRQMLHETDFVSDSKIIISSTILGCEFNIYFNQDKELLLDAETLLAFFESFLSTSLENIYPHCNVISLVITRNIEIECINFRTRESSNDYIVEIGKSGFSMDSNNETWKRICSLVIDILVKNFFIVGDSLETYLGNLFENELLNERLSFILQHKKFLYGVLGASPKILADNWLDNTNIIKYPMKRKTSIIFEANENRDDYFENYDKISFSDLGHNKRSTYSVFDVPLWEEAEWSGFGFYVDSESMKIMLSYENRVAGEKIFSNWVKTIGKEDVNELIRITIIKGIDRNHPFWYRVHICSNIDEIKPRSSKVIISLSKCLTMTPSSSENLDRLISEFNICREYELCPSKINIDGGIEPFFDKAILKRSLFIKNAWEIGEDDFDRVAIQKDDLPIIPSNIKIAPVLKLINENIK
jgi:hypothetical protein